MKLAINGGPKVRNCLFPEQKTEFEINSLYRGSWGSNFWGGPRVQKLERNFAKMISPDIKALAVNSCTSALQIACGAIGLKSGDEVIVTPWSMSCSATAPMLWGAIPVFADIDPETFCLSPESIRSKITGYTKAIIVVDLFGHLSDVVEIYKIAKEHNLYVIEDAAQAIGASNGIGNAGQFGDISCFSFTQGKHLSAGEGGMITVANEELYMKCALLRNHAEAVVNGMPESMQQKYNKMIGFNMRMTESGAEMIDSQILDLSRYIDYRIENANYLYEEICKLPGIRKAIVHPGHKHVYYCQPFHFDQCVVGIHRDKFIKAVKAELMEETGRIDRGVPINAGYIKPLYKFPIFQDREIVPLPVVERLQNQELFISLYCGLELSKYDRQDIVDAFVKVYENINEIM